VPPSCAIACGIVAAPGPPDSRPDSPLPHTPHHDLHGGQLTNLDVEQDINGPTVAWIPLQRRGQAPPIPCDSVHGPATPDPACNHLMRSARALTTPDSLHRRPPRPLCKPSSRSHRPTRPQPQRTQSVTPPAAASVTDVRSHPHLSGTSESRRFCTESGGADPQIARR
jgi:hypothetical protein